MPSQTDFYVFCTTAGTSLKTKLSCDQHLDDPNSLRKSSQVRARDLAYTRMTLELQNATDRSSWNVSYRGRAHRVHRHHSELQKTALHTTGIAVCRGPETRAKPKWLFLKITRPAQCTKTSSGQPAGAAEDIKHITFVNTHNTK